MFLKNNTQGSSSLCMNKHLLTHSQTGKHTRTNTKRVIIVCLTNVVLDQWGLGKRVCTWQTETKSKVVFTWHTTGHTTGQTVFNWHTTALTVLTWHTTAQTVLTWHTTVQSVISEVVKYKHKKDMLQFLLVLKTGLETPKWLRGQWKPFLFLWNSALHKKLVTLRHT